MSICIPRFSSLGRRPRRRRMCWARWTSVHKKRPIGEGGSKLSLRFHHGTDTSPRFATWLCGTREKLDDLERIITDWWFGTCFIFHNIWDSPSHWLIFFKMVETTNQIRFGTCWGLFIPIQVIFGRKWSSHPWVRFAPWNMLELCSQLIINIKYLYSLYKYNIYILYIIYIYII